MKKNVMDKKVGYVCKIVLKYFMVLFFSVFIGCFSLTNLQSPEVLKENEVSGGIGIYPHEAKPKIEKFGFEYLVGGFELTGRMGLGKNYDFGVKAYGFPKIITGGIACDIKYQFLSDPIIVSSSLEASYSTHKAVETSTIHLFEGTGFTIQHYREMYGIHPTLLVGTRNLYGGVKIFNLFSSGYGYYNINGVFVGCAVESSLIWACLEIGNYSPVDQGTLVLLAIGFQIKLSSENGSLKFMR